MNKYRAFICYSHGNEKEFRAVMRSLKRPELEVWSDRELRAGQGFTDQIRLRITHSHVFVPILTPLSHKRGWVHQEIGYAVAMRLPVVPVCIGRLPHGMIEMNQAVVPKNIRDDLDDKMAKVNIAALIEESGKGGFPQIACALRPEERAQQIEEHADDARRCIGPQCVRYSASLTSFSLPDEPPEHPAWVARYGGSPRSRFALELFRRERQALEKHAQKMGCRLLIHTGYHPDSDYGAGARHTRLLVLMKFLESISDKVEVCVVNQETYSSVLMVGDWVMAESHSLRPIHGIQHTSFTAHAPAIRRRIDEFDSDFHNRLREAGINPRESKRIAIQQLQELLKVSPPHPAWP